MDLFYNNKFAIFVMSCDKTSDVCKHFIKAYKKKKLILIIRYLLELIKISKTQNYLIQYIYM